MRPIACGLFNHVAGLIMVSVQARGRRGEDIEKMVMRGMMGRLTCKAKLVDKELQQPVSLKMQSHGRYL